MSNMRRRFSALLTLLALPAAAEAEKGDIGCTWEQPLPRGTAHASATFAPAQNRWVRFSFVADVPIDRVTGSLAGTFDSKDVTIQLDGEGVEPHLVLVAVSFPATDAYMQRDDVVRLYRALDGTTPLTKGVSSQNEVARSDMARALSTARDPVIGLEEDGKILVSIHLHGPTYAAAWKSFAALRRQSLALNPDPARLPAACSVVTEEASRPCFFTTAVVHCLALSDDCWELSQLRAMRDAMIASGGAEGALVEQYVEHAPSIVRGIARRHDATRIWCTAYWSGILPAAILASLGLRRPAIQLYLRLFQRLSLHATAA